MKPEEKRFIKRFNIAFVMIVLSSVPIALIPLADFNGNMRQKVLAYTIGLLFWSLFIIGSFFFAVANKKRKELAKKEEKKSIKRRGFPGLSFFHTKPGANVDVIFFVFLVCYVALAIFKFDISWIKIELVFLLVLSFQMHCILNGENFKYKKYILRRKK